MSTFMQTLRLFTFLLVGALSQLAPPLSAAPPDDSPVRIKANNVVQLNEQVGREVTVYGRVVRTSTSSRSRHQFLNFYDDAVSVICFAEDVGNFEGGGPASLFKDKDVEITGRLERYRDKLQIKLRTPSQIRIVSRSSSTTAPANPTTPSVELKKIGPDTWLSPAGLRYQGRDPEGLTRVEHVLRHARDMPSRDGPHGVFDGGEARVFAVIDEGWRLAQEKRIRPDVERDRSVYLIPMGRRIGYLGGRTGASRGKPPLSRLFLVMETRTRSVVTAFPR
jgi:hypothetical protein